MLLTAYFQTDQGAPLWLWYVILGVLLLLLLTWWLMNRRSGEPVIRPLEEAMKATPERRSTEKDDLQKIEGIGPKVARVLNDAGITTFEALARAEPDEIKTTLNAAGLQMMNPEGWIEQAELAAKGDWNGLEQLQGELKGGRRT